MAAKKVPALTSLEKRVTELEKTTGDNQRTLDVQFERIASIQADVDRMRAIIRRHE